jgi:hypothetical protein
VPGDLNNLHMFVTGLLEGLEGREKIPQGLNPAGCRCSSAVGATNGCRWPISANGLFAQPKLEGDHLQVWPRVRRHGGVQA